MMIHSHPFVRFQRTQETDPPQISPNGHTYILSEGCFVCTRNECVAYHMMIDIPSQTKKDQHTTSLLNFCCQVVRGWRCELKRFPIHKNCMILVNLLHFS